MIPDPEGHGTSAGRRKRSRFHPSPPDYSGFREPAQERSKARVRQIKDACAAVLATGGVHGLTPTAIARQAGIPVPALYRYFDDVDSIVMSLLADWEADAYRLHTLLPEHEVPKEPTTSVRALIHRGFSLTLERYERHPAFVEIVWRHPRVVPRVAGAMDYFNLLSSQDFRAALWNQGLVGAEFTPARALFAVEMMNRTFQIAYHDSNVPDRDAMHEGEVMLSRYVENYPRC